MTSDKQKCLKCGAEVGDDAAGYPCDNCLKEKDSNEINDETFEQKLLDNIGNLT